MGRLEKISILQESKKIGAIRFTSDNQYELALETDEDASFWIAVLMWIDYQLSVGNKRRQ